MRLQVLLLLTVVAASAYPRKIIDFETSHMGHEQKGVAGKSVVGEYSWKAPNGQTFHVSYSAGRNGYQILNTQPPKRTYPTPTPRYQPPKWKTNARRPHRFSSPTPHPLPAYNSWSHSDAYSSASETDEQDEEEDFDEDDEGYETEEGGEEAEEADQGEELAAEETEEEASYKSVSLDVVAEGEAEEGDHNTEGEITASDGGDAEAAQSEAEVIESETEVIESEPEVETAEEASTAETPAEEKSPETEPTTEPPAQVSEAPQPETKDTNQTTIESTYK